METKFCKKCGEEKNIDEFSTDKRNKNGLSCKCKTCYKEYRDTHFKKYQKNKEKATTYNKIYYQLNKEKIINAVREWEKLNPNIKYKEAKAKASRKYYNNNIDLVKEKSKNRHKKAKEQCKDFYIKRLLKEDGFSSELINPELIIIKRDIIKIKRVIKQIKTKQDE